MYYSGELRGGVVFSRLLATKIKEVNNILSTSKVHSELNIYCATYTRNDKQSFSVCSVCTFYFTRKRQQRFPFG